MILQPRGKNSLLRETHIAPPCFAYVANSHAQAAQILRADHSNDSKFQMNALPTSLPIMPRLHKTERDMPPIAMHEKSAVTDEAVVRVTTLATAEDEVMDVYDSGRGIQRTGRMEFKYKPMQGSRSGTVEDMSDPFAEPLD